MSPRSFNAICDALKTIFEKFNPANTQITSATQDMCKPERI